MNRLVKFLVGGFIVVVSVESLFLWYANKNLSYKLAESEAEANEYQRKLRNELMPSPTPPSIKEYYQSNYRPKPEIDYISHELDCTDDLSVLGMFSSLTKDDVLSRATYACRNVDQGSRWVVFLENHSTEEELSSQYFQKLIYVDLANSEIEVMHESKSFSQCERAIQWLESGWIYFSCYHVPNGRKGNFYTSGPNMYAYYLGNGETYQAENCQKTKLVSDPFEYDFTGPLACTSLCKSDNDCRKNHFCDAALGLCINKCTSDFECTGPFNGHCIAYANPKIEEFENWTNFIPYVRLGCGIGKY